MCTADPIAEPPALVMSTVLSLMAYDYAPEKLSIYLSDDAGSILTFYALWEVSHFAKHWLPYCKKFSVEPRSPAAYFSMSYSDHETFDLNEWSSMKVTFLFKMQAGTVLNDSCFIMFSLMKLRGTLTFY